MNTILRILSLSGWNNRTKTAMAFGLIVGLGSFIAYSTGRVTGLGEAIAGMIMAISLGMVLVLAVTLYRTKS